MKQKVVSYNIGCGVRTRHDPRVRVAFLRSRAYSTPPIPMVPLTHGCEDLPWATMVPALQAEDVAARQ
jgi:hypothetical protein